MEKGQISASAWPYYVKVYWKRIVELPKTIEEPYERLLYVYENFRGGKYILEDRIVSIMKRGLSREEAIHKLAEKEDILLSVEKIWPESELRDFFKSTPEFDGYRCRKCKLIVFKY